MRDWPGIIATTAVGLFILIVAGTFIALGVWTWQNAEDKRDCRRARGTVVEIDHGEWHCIGATPGTAEVP